MAEIKTNFGEGGANLVPGGSGGDPDLATALRDIADDLAQGPAAQVPAWQAAAAVAADTVVLPTAGLILAVDAVAGTLAGPKVQAFGAPAAGECQVVYDANGVPTLNFNAADGITSVRVVQLVRTSGYTLKTTKG
jgi:hypothetical protein